MNLDIKPTFWRWLPWLIIAFGFLLRLDQYLFNRSLWLDEVLFAVNVVNKTFLELFQAPLDYVNYNRPPGFLLIAKLSITWFGNSDFILRFFPFFCGTLSLLLYYRMAKVYISEHAVPLALFFFAISETLIFYSSEFKQYSSDVLIVILLFLLIANYRTYALTFTKLFVLAIVGMIAIWFSYASVFILATIGIYLALPYLVKKQWQPVIKLTAVYLIWLLNFALLYVFFISVETPMDKWADQFWVIANSFMPSPFSLEGFYWLYNKFFMVLENPGGLGSSQKAGLASLQLAGLGIIIGCIVLFAEKKWTLFLLIFPVVIALCVSFFHQYPFSERLLLFLTPGLYLILAEGITKIQINISHSSRLSPVYTMIAKVIVIAFLVIYPTSKAIQHWSYPRVIQEIKPILAHIEKHRQSTDIIYLYYWAEPAFRYYAANYNLNYEDCHIITPIPKNEYTKEVDYFRSKQDLKPVSVDKTQCILGASETFYQSQPDLEQLQNRGRVWFVFSHSSEYERNFFLNYLDSKGVRIDENLQPGAYVYLYDLQGLVKK
jgi:uncharacterized membrane protein